MRPELPVHEMRAVIKTGDNRLFKAKKFLFSAPALGA